HEQDAATTEVRHPDLILAVDRHAPGYVDHLAAVEAHRRGLSAVGANHVDHARDIPGFEGLHQMLAGDLKLFHHRHAVGNDRRGKVQGHVARHPEIAL